MQTKNRTKCNAKFLMDSQKYQSTEKSCGSYGGIRNNFSQSCEKRTRQVAFIISALIRQWCDRTS